MINPCHAEDSELNPLSATVKKFQMFNADYRHSMDGEKQGTPAKKIMALEEDTACVTLGGNSQHNETKPSTIGDNKLYSITSKPR